MEFMEKLKGSNGAVWVTAFERFLQMEDPWALKFLEKRSFSWDGDDSKEELLVRLRTGRSTGSPYPDTWTKATISMEAMLIIESIAMIPEPVEINFGWIRVADLGFAKTPTTDELFGRIQMYGDLCEVEDILHLLCKYFLGFDGMYQMAMKPVADSNGDPCILHVSTPIPDLPESKTKLFVGMAETDVTWGLNRVVMFRPRR